MRIITEEKRTELLDLAESVLERFQSNRLTCVPLISLEDLPSSSGVYFVATPDKTVLYIGKAINLSNRCNIGTHHKLPTAIERGAVYIYIACIPPEDVWYVEQKLISAIKPDLNESVSRWWINVTQKATRPTRSQHQNKCSMLPKDFVRKYRVNADLLADLLDVSISSAQKWLAPNSDREVPAYIQAALDCHDERLERWKRAEEELADSQVRFPISLLIYEKWTQD